MYYTMDVLITRDCQIDDLFHEKGEQITIADIHFNADCMMPLVAQEEIVAPSDSDPPEEIPKQPKKHKK
jgi:hypothetical protein